ncbi:MAG: hypothetical protein PHR16_02150 [Methylovulum sp.]|nr:hypothetical protein [Methylovulum sp.]
MKNYLLFISGFVAVSWFFLTGFTKPVERHTIKNKAVAESPQHDEALDEKQVKPLDLSVPFKAIKSAENTRAKNQASKTDQKGGDNLFAPEPEKETQPLQIKGGWLMSPEPEVEKSKSVDGAGIVINVKP